MITYAALSNDDGSRPGESVEAGDERNDAIILTNEIENDTGLVNQITI
jgi:hypothetical protein